MRILADSEVLPAEPATVVFVSHNLRAIRSLCQTRGGSLAWPAGSGGELNDRGASESKGWEVQPPQADRGETPHPPHQVQHSHQGGQDGQPFQHDQAPAPGTVRRPATRPLVAALRMKT
jgi:hypothetical protein